MATPRDRYSAPPVRFLVQQDGEDPATWHVVDSANNTIQATFDGPSSARNEADATERARALDRAYDTRVLAAVQPAGG